MARLLILTPDATSMARLRGALRHDHDLTPCEDWSAVWHRLQKSGADGVLLDPFATRPTVPTSEIRRLRLRFPFLVIVLIGDPTGQAREMPAMGSWSDRMILAGVEDDARTIRRVVEEAIAKSVGRRVYSAISDVVSELEATALAWSAEHATDAPNVRALADAMGKHPEALSRELRREGGDTARRILLWGRLFRAAQILSTTDATVQQTALGLGYSNDSSFRRTIRSHLGVAPTQVARYGGMSHVLECFLETRERHYA